MDLGKIAIDDIWLGLRILNYDRSHYTIKNAVDINGLYVVERRKRLVPIGKLKELFGYLGVVIHPDNLLRVCGRLSQ